MSHGRWDRISATFLAAIDLPSAERAAFLDRACAEDAAVRAEVEAMLDGEDSGQPLAIEERLVPPAPFPPLAPGTRLGPYRIGRLVGQGGMGEVYEGERVDGEYSQTVAIKLLRPGYLTAETVRRFRTERQVLARLTHPGIAAILDGGTAQDGRPYLVLQYVDGTRITDYCRGRELSVDDRLRLFLRVAEAVHFAHGHLVVHRDLKPSNILVQDDGSPRLLDFGIAKLLDSDAAPTDASTRPDTRLLTPEHAAPEQLRGEPVTIATDVYGLGVLLFELLTDRRPFTRSGRTPRELERLIVEADAAEPSAVAPSRAVARRLRGDLDRIVLKALRKEPERRYGSAGQLAEDVQRFLDGLPVTAQRDTVAYRTRKFVARHRAAVIGAALGVSMLAAFAALSAVQARRLARERDVAERERASAEQAVAALTDLVRRANPIHEPGGDTLRLATVLADAERWVDGLAGDPARQAQLSRATGNMLAARGEYVRAKTMLTRARDLLRRSPQDSTTLALVEHELAMVVLQHEGEAAARPLLQRSVAAVQSAFGARHPDATSAVRDLALVTADAERRRALLDSATALREGEPDPDPVQRAAQLNASGSERFARGQLREALAEFETSLDILGQVLPPDHPHRRAVTRNVVSTLTKLGRWERAEAIHRPVLERSRRDTVASVTTANDLNMAGVLAAHRGRLAEAEADLRQALALYRRLLAVDHFQIDNTLRNLGAVVASRGRVAEGLALLDSAVTRARGKVRETQQSAGYMNGQRVPLLLFLGRIDAADSAATEASETLRAGTASDDIARSDAELWLGLVALARGATDDAVSRFAAAAERLEPVLEPGHPAVARARCAGWLALRRAGRAAESTAPQACEIHADWGLADPMVVRWTREAGAAPRP